MCLNLTNRVLLQDGADDITALMAAMPDAAAPKATFAKGDRVIVTTGELVNLEGVVEEVVPEEGKVMLRPLLEGMEDDLVDVLVEELKKMVSVSRDRGVEGNIGGQCNLYVRGGIWMCL